MAGNSTSLTFHEYIALHRDRLREMDEAAASDGAENTFDISFNSCVMCQGQGCHREVPKDDEYDSDWHEMWYRTIQSARYIEWKSLRHDTWVVLILQAKAMGPLRRARRVLNGQTSEEGTMTWESARASNGERLMSDLPFMLDDFHSYWRTALTTWSPDELANFAGLLSRLICVGADHRLAVCVLLIFREALETPFPSGQDEGGRTAKHFLPAMKPFMVFTRVHIFRLVVESYNDFPEHFEESTRPGELAQAEGLQQGGFYPARWMFWLKALDGLTETAHAKLDEVEIDLETPTDIRVWHLNVMKNLHEDWAQPFGGTRQSFGGVDEI